MNYVEKYRDETISAYKSVDEKEVFSAIHILSKARDQKKRIFIMGNGGSSSNASHFVNGLSQGANTKGKSRFRAISLTDNTPNLSAYANDIGYENVFAEQLKNLLDPGDIVIGISGSGNSNNVLNAIDYANKNNAITIGMCGFDGGKLKGMCKYPIHVKSDCMEIVEDVHLSLTHLISSYLKNEE